MFSAKFVPRSRSIRRTCEAASLDRGSGRIGAVFSQEGQAENVSGIWNLPMNFTTCGIGERGVGGCRKWRWSSVAQDGSALEVVIIFLWEPSNHENAIAKCRKSVRAGLGNQSRSDGDFFSSRTCVTRWLWKPVNAFWRHLTMARVMARIWRDCMTVA